ncbi:MAG: FliM/FliN family flagellar motor switch protein [Treponema sp.]|nr:FliM/FliN family flagellar motor switch protein [Treponema sp.]
MDTTRQNDFALVTQPGNSGVSLGDFNMPEGKKLETGTVIELTKMAGEPVDLFDKKTGRIFAHGEVVVSDEKFCVRVTEVLDTPDSDGSGTKKA